MSFTYDDNGLRTSKTVNGITTEYYWNGNLLVAEQTPYSLTVYNYDATGRPIGMSYRENTYGQYQWDVYWFDLNLQGDIVAVYNKTGVKLVSYSYDPWGKCTVNYSNGGASTSATKNNLRYRGYYLDSDLGLYYLQSRYYDPNTYRFINADCYLSTGQGILGYNMYAYCRNNPVNRTDKSGEFWRGVVLIVIAVAVVVGHVAAGINKIQAEKIVDDLKANDEDESSEKLMNDYLSNIYGNDTYVDLSDPKNAHIENGADVNFRDRMVISILLSEHDYTQRSAANLAAEWEAHNIFDFITGGKSAAARDVDLNSNFWDNAWYTEAGTIICHILGWY